MGMANHRRTALSVFAAGTAHLAARIAIKACFPWDTLMPSLAEGFTTEAHRTAVAVVRSGMESVETQATDQAYRLATTTGVALVTCGPVEAQRVATKGMLRGTYDLACSVTISAWCHTRHILISILLVAAPIAVGAGTWIYCGRRWPKRKAWPHDIQGRRD